jgi:tetratricopeptide (TPR) repeat protein
MKSFRYCYFLLVFSVLGVSSCNKRLLLSESGGNANAKYDTAAFNYVYVEALKQKLMGNGGDALKYLEQSIKIYPLSDAAYYEMAQIVVAGGDTKNGKRFITKALSIDDENIWYLTMLAGLYYQEKNLDSAIIYYENAVKEFPEKLNLKLTLGNLYSENKN